MSTAPFSPFDHAMMGIALRMARRGLGQTAPNPAVGAVIADEAAGVVLARGWTQPGGRPHAETEAIRRAGAAARGKTIYVTLEPCAHHGKTPPCADAIVAAGLARCVAAVEDPDPRTAGRGLDRLRAAGIDVARGLRTAEARWLTRGHIVRVTERRPFVTLKIAASADGAVPRGGAGRPVWVTGTEARALGHLLRAEADAILIGRGTLADDDPELTCRLPGLSGRSPVRVVLASDPHALDGTRLAAGGRRQAAGGDAHPPVWLFTRGAERGAPLDAAQGVRGFSVPTVDGRLWLPAVMEALVAEGITRLLVEGGPEVWRAFAAHRLVDEIHLFVGGGGVPPSPAGRAQDIVTRLVGPLPLVTVETRRAGDDAVVVFRVAAATHAALKLSPRGA